MLMFAVLARERGHLFRFLLLPFLICLVTTHGSAASAASLYVKIRQINPAGDVQQVTCESRKKCALPIDIQTGTTKQTLTAGISYALGNLLIQFQTPKGFLYAGDKVPADAKHPLYEAVWPVTVPKAQPATTQVTLFEPLVPSPITALPLDKPGKAVADLEITVEAKP